MTPLTDQSILLKDLLNRFVDEELLTAEVLASVHKYLFIDETAIPFFRNAELYETVIYLKDIMQRNDLFTLNDIQHYYDQKRARFRRRLQQEAPNYFSTEQQFISVAGTVSNTTCEIHCHSAESMNNLQKMLHGLPYLGCFLTNLKMWKNTEKRDESASCNKHSSREKESQAVNEKNKSMINSELKDFSSIGVSE